MVSVKSIVISGAALAIGAVADDKMGPAAFMWPVDREWSAGADNTPPCGTTAGPGARTEFPLVNGKLALVTQDSTRSVHVGVSYLNDPKSMDDFETFYGPSEVGPLDLGHTCITVPDAPATAAAGSNATFYILYVANFEDNEAERETFYACADVTFVEKAAFTAAIPCFNSTVSDPDVETDPTVEVTTTGPDGKTPHTADDFAVKSGSSGPSAGTIAAAVVGPIGGIALIAAAFWLYRRNAQKELAAKEQESMRQVKWDEEKAASDNASQRS